MKHLFKFSLLLLALLLPVTAIAYDFEVDGIYYNISSNNTVEVTYKDTNYASYSGEVIIPSTITRNGKAYTVNVIGDRAFYNSSVSSVTIPETVTSIGEAAFYGCWLDAIICLSSTPPIVNNSFDYEPNSDFIYPDINEDEAWNYYYRVLFVPEDAYGSYCESSMTSFFDYVIFIGTELERTSEPSISVVIRGYDVSIHVDAEEGSKLYVRYDIISASGLYIQEGWWEEYNEYYNYESYFDRYYLKMYAFAISDGKLPSQLVRYESPLIDGHTYDQEPSPMFRGDVNKDSSVNIEDLTELIDILLQGKLMNDYPTADVDGDKIVTISDVTVLIDFLLGGAEYFTVNGVNFTMIRVPAGTFMMGATEEQGSDANNWEKPVHEVTLSSSYLIGETEVTQELWLAVMGTNPSKHEGSLQKPVENVSWLDCQEFISRLNELTGLSFRLPTEAEWEFAARGGNRSKGYKYAGSDNINDVAWYHDNTPSVGPDGLGSTQLVATKAPNELYLYDMSGNVDEWVWDYFDYYTSEPQTNPSVSESSYGHTYRGGSWYSGANTARVSYRFFRDSTFHRGTMGLRLAL